LAQIFEADGTKSGSEFQINANVSGTQFDPIITALADGRFVVSWTDGSATLGDASGYAVHGRVFDSNGNVVVNEFLVNTTTSGNQQHVAITAITGGGFVVAWTDQPSASPRAQIYDQDGNKVGTELAGC
jgi:hypothetical protein